jgi:hypothetical protein
VFETSSGNVYGTGLSIKPHYSVAYTYLAAGVHFRSLMPRSHTAHGRISKKARTRIITAMQWMMMFSNRKFVYSKAKKRGFWFKVNFITLTLSAPQHHTDKEIVHLMLRPFLKWMRRQHNVINYLWKAEIQPSRLLNRGERCIHFHITTNKFIHYRQLKNKWNALQLAHGYREPGDEPNSTDVHSVINEGKIIGYMAKYLIKEPARKDYPGITNETFEKLHVTCKIWGMNHELSRMKATLLEEDNTDFYTDLEYFLNTTQAVEKEGNHCTIYLHQLNIEHQYPVAITKPLTALYHLFNKGDDNVTKYSIE